MNQAPSDRTASLAHLSPDLAAVCERFGTAWRQTDATGLGPRIEEYLSGGHSRGSGGIALATLRKPIRIDTSPGFCSQGRTTPHGQRL